MNVLSIENNDGALIVYCIYEPRFTVCEEAVEGLPVQVSCPRPNHNEVPVAL